MHDVHRLVLRMTKEEMLNHNNKWYVDDMYYGNGYTPSGEIFRIHRETEQVQVLDERDYAWVTTTREVYETAAAAAWRKPGEARSFFAES